MGHGKVDAMNKNTSPQTRSASRSRAQVRGRGGAGSSKPAARVANKVGSQARARRATAPTTLAGRIRRMLWTVAIPNAVVVLVVLAVALAALLLTSSPLAWLPTIVAEAWMVFNLAPISAGGIELSVLPLLPAGVLAFIVGRRIRQAIKHKVSIKDLLVLLGCVVGVPLLLSIIAWLMLWDAGKVFDVSPPNFFVVLPRMLLLHLSALAGGMGSRLWKALVKRFGMPRMLVDAAQVALRYLGVLFAASAVVCLIVAIVGWSRQSEMMNAYPSIDGLGGFLLYLISALYIPNAVIGTGGILSGSEFQFGPESSISLFSIHMVSLPPLPIVGVVPSSIAPWAVGLLVVPIASAIYVVWRARRHVNFFFAVAASAFVAFFTLLLSYFVSGVLGIYGTTGLNVWTATGLVALWFAAIALGFACAFAIGAWHASRNASAAAAAESDKAEEAAADAAFADAEAEEAEVEDAEAEETAPNTSEGAVAESIKPDAASENATGEESAEEESVPEEPMGAPEEESVADAPEDDEADETAVEKANESAEEAAEEAAEETAKPADSGVEAEVIDGEIVEEFPQEPHKD